MTTDILAERSIDPSARMQLRNMGELNHPGACAVCGNGTCDQGYVDIGVYYEYEGMMYLCIPCVTELAETAGMLSIEQVAELKNITNEALAENKVLKTRQVKLNERIKHYDALLGINADGVATVTDVPISDAISESAKAEPAPELSNEPVVNEPAVSGEAKQPEPAKPAKGSGRSVPARPTSSDISI